MWGFWGHNRDLGLSAVETWMSFLPLYASISSSISGTNIHLWVLLCQHILPLVFRKGEPSPGSIDIQRGHYTGGSRDWYRIWNYESFLCQRLQSWTQLPHVNVPSLTQSQLNTSLTMAMLHGPCLLSDTPRGCSSPPLRSLYRQQESKSTRRAVWAHWRPEH